MPFSHTKKVGPAGRFKSRYGLRIRKRVVEIEVVQRQRHICPKCKKRALKRVAPGIWECKSCGLKIAGFAYKPPTAKNV